MYLVSLKCNNSLYMKILYKIDINQSKKITLQLFFNMSFWPCDCPLMIFLTINLIYLKDIQTIKCLI